MCVPFQVGQMIKRIRIEESGITIGNVYTVVRTAETFFLSFSQIDNDNGDNYNISEASAFVWEVVPPHINEGALYLLKEDS